MPYPIPDDGPVGAMLASNRPAPVAARAHPLPHHAQTSYRPLTTHVFDADSAYLDFDAVFGVQGSLATGALTNRLTAARSGPN